jgi:hypothetical protein
MFTFPILRKRHQATPGLATFHHGDVFLPGAGNAVYEPAPPVIAAVLPIVQLIGASIIAGRAPSPHQLPQVYANQTALIAGIGGVLAGQIYGQPLNVPETTNGNQ